MNNSKTYILLIIIVVAIFSACTPQPKNNLIKNGPDYSDYDSSTTAILTWTKEAHYIFDSVSYKAASLSPIELQQIDSLLAIQISDYNNSMVGDQAEFRIDIKRNHYKKQLLAVTNRDNEKEIWVNCLCRSVQSFRKKIFRVEDGGPCYFNFKVNLKKKKIYDFMVNGIA